MKIGGLINLTLLDYSEKIACTVFTLGCNFRCPFCHNASLVEGRNCQNPTEQSILEFLRKRKGVLEGVCLTGGEPLLQPNVKDFLQEVKSLGYAVKLDTNGSFPEKLMELVELKLIDYVAMDVKNCKEKYSATAGTNVELSAVERSVDFLMSQKMIDFEFRTTVTATYHDEKSMEKLAEWIAGEEKYYLQQFVNSGDLIDGSTIGVDEETLKHYLEVVRKYLPNAQIRGV